MYRLAKKVVTIGNSYGIVIPIDIVEAMNIHKGDILQVEIENVRNGDRTKKIR